MNKYKLKNKKRITTILLVLLAVAAGTGITVLLAAANGKQDDQLCKGVTVSINSNGEKFFIEKEDILKNLQTTAGGSLIHQPVTAINLAQLEKKLEKHPWIRDAELYFDSRRVLYVAVREREPIARIFTTAGSSFYIDREGKRLPVLEKVVVRLPVVTNFTAKKWNKKDSALLQHITALVQYIAGDDFWRAQIAQLDVTPSGGLEAVPVVGNHTIRLGTGSDFEDKLHRLFVFYKQVLSRVGFDKYAVVDVRFNGQVIGVRKGPASVVDSVQLQKNIRELMERSQLRIIEDSLANVEKVKAQLRRDTALKKLMETLMQPEENEINIDTAFAAKPVAQLYLPTTNPNPVKSGTTSRPAEKRKTPGNTNNRKPKAVMPQRTHA